MIQTSAEFELGAVRDFESQVEKKPGKTSRKLLLQKRTLCKGSSSYNTSPRVHTVETQTRKLEKRRKRVQLLQILTKCYKMSFFQQSVSIRKRSTDKFAVWSGLVSPDFGSFLSLAREP